MRRYGRESGFTIVELMIIVTIIGILIALVLPNMRTSAARARMTEAMLAFGPCRALVTEVYGASGDIPNPGEWGCEIAANASQYVDSVTTDTTGKITLALRGFNDGRIDHRDLTLQPLDNTGSVPSGNGAPVTRWRCGSIIDGTDTFLLPYLPSSCRG
jgi:type II secretory pathway pseudopilin PulG